MARTKGRSRAKKKTTKKNSTSLSTKTVNDASKREITGIFTVAFAVFLIVVTAGENQTGIIGKTINVFTHSVLGRGADILPFFILAIGIMRLLNVEVLSHNSQIDAIAGFFVCFIIYFALADINILKESTGFKSLFKSSMETGLLKRGGGIIGNTITYIFLKLFGKNGTYIVLGALIFSNFVLLTKQSIIGIFRIISGALNKILRAVYSFIFIEEDEEESESETGSKKAVNNQTKAEEKIKIYDYVNIPENKKAEITQMKIDDDDDIKEEDAAETKHEAAIGLNGKKFEPQKITDDIINIAGVKNTNYKFPPTSLLEPVPRHVKGRDKENLKKDGEKLIETLNNFNIPCNILQINKGPTITRYEIQPAPGIKVSRITGLSSDIALALATSDIRMEAPIPGKSAIGIEVPNKIKTSVSLRSLIESKEYKNADTNIPFALGKDIAGKNIISSIDKMPHLLIAGATGSGKSVCINSLIMSILFKAKPEDVKLILIDPKVVELSVYNGLPHLLIPVVTDPRKAANALNWAVSEMTNRYKIFAQNSVRDLASFNDKMDQKGKEKMAKIVIIIDELADLMTAASSEVEEYITRIAQLARACGMHLVIATQRPSVDVITGVIKANIPSRIAFAVSSHIDSRTILDTGGAEKLLGKGDMLYHPMGLPKPIRIQGTFISDDEINVP